MVRSRVRLSQDDDGEPLVQFLDAGGVAEQSVRRPYAFVLRSAQLRLRHGCERSQSDFLSVDGRRPLDVFECPDPKQIALVRDDGAYDVTYEADVPFIRRLFTDFQLVTDYEQSAVAYIDVEVDDSVNPASPNAEILSAAFVRDGGLEFVRGETEVIEAVADMIRGGKTVLSGWNVRFDYEKILARARALGMKREHELIMFAELVDLYELYKSEVKGLGSYTLYEVARHEGMDVSGKAIRGSRRVSDLSSDELRQYNMWDAEAVAQIDSKYGFTSLMLELANIVNLPLSVVLSESGGAVRTVTLADTLIVRRAHELGLALRNAVQRSSKTGYAGAKVLKPPSPGMFRRVAVLDCESMYPNIIVNECIDVPGGDCQILPFVMREVLEARRSFRQAFKETGDVRYDVKQKAFKVIANSLYGVFGTPGFRYFDEGIAARVTSKGRELLDRISSAAVSLGHRVIYGDTDSVFVQLGEGADDQAIDSLLNALNKAIAPYRVKLEYVGDVLFPLGSGARDAVKKRYILRTEDGEFIVRGLELRRSDWDAFTKRLVWQVVSMLFEGRSRREIESVLLDERAKLMRGEYDELLVMSKSIQHGRQYAVNAEHVRAFRKAVAAGIPVSGRVMYVYVNYGDGVEPVRDVSDVARLKGRIDYRRYWLKAMAAVRRVLSAAMLSTSLIRR